MMRVKVLSRSTTEPVSLDEARLHLRLDAYDSPAAHPDDALIQDQIAAAREWAERFTGRTITQATIEAVADEFPWCSSHLWGRYETLALRLPGGPVRAVVSVKYVDGSGVEQHLTGYQLDDHSEPPRIAPAAGSTWPATQDQTLNAVRVRYDAGYDVEGDSPDAHPLPKPIKQAILLLLGYLYENREDGAGVPADVEAMPLSAKTLLRKYRLQNGFA